MSYCCYKKGFKGLAALRCRFGESKGQSRMPLSLKRGQGIERANTGRNRSSSAVETGLESVWL